LIDEVMFPANPPGRPQSWAKAFPRRRESRAVASDGSPGTRNGEKALPLPFALDFYPLEAPEFTRIHPFFENLRKTRLTTTKCTKCGAVHWQPRVVCPKCNSDSLEWIDLPKEGELFAFTEVRAGAPIGFEEDVPFVTGLVRLKGTEILLTARIDGAKYGDLKIGDRVRLKVIVLPDGRVWFRFTPGAGPQ
jgi:uncharacterized OB-fold protein